jgi:hypothetical protein
MIALNVVMKWILRILTMMEQIIGAMNAEVQ